VKTYVPHYAPLAERKERVSLALSNQGVDATFITDEPDSFFNECYFKNESFWNFKNSFLDYGTHIPFRDLKKSDISLIYKHWKILNLIASSNEENEYYLVLEDDVILDNDFLNKCTSNLKSTPENWDLIFIGSGCNLRIHPSYLREGQVAYLKGHPATKCTDSFFIKKKAASLIAATFLPYVLPIDFELNYQLYLHKMNVYWWEPPLVAQGSETGLYKSTARCDF